MISVPIKPLTVNQAWQGRRFKTDSYKKYEIDVMLLLPKLTIPDGKLAITITAGLSNAESDIDNIAKPFIDILQKKYEFNDKQIYQLMMFKTIVQKGNEYIKFHISKLIA